VYLEEMHPVTDAQLRDWWKPLTTMEIELMFERGRKKIKEPNTRKKFGRIYLRWKTQENLTPTHLSMIYWFGGTE
jgi:hypothetical protein